MPDNLITITQLRDGMARAKSSWDLSVSELANAVTEAIEELEANSVLIVEQTFTAAQKAIARNNIGAAESGHTHSAMTGATASAAGTAGFVPAPGAGKNTAFLRGDGTWVVPTDTVYTHPDSVTAGTASEGGSARTLAFGGTFNIPSVTYNAQGHITGKGSIQLKLPATPSDTKNTAGSTDTSSKIFLIGATSQAANPQTYSHDTAYVGTDGCLYSNGKKVEEIPSSVTGSGSITVTIANNTVYEYTGVTTLNMTGNTNEACGFVTFGSSAPSVTVSGFTGSSGDDITSAAAGQVWEFNCFKGRIIWKNWSA